MYDGKIEYKKIPLTQGKFAVVDGDDHPLLLTRSWRVACCSGKLYAVSGRAGSEVLMHRYIMGTPEGKDTHHIDGDGLNNTRRNLQICTHAENSRKRCRQSNNSSGYNGVSWKKSRGRWVSYICVRGRSHYLGSSTCLVKAARIYDKAAKKYHGDFASLNFPE